MHLFYVDESGSADPLDTKRPYFVLVAAGVRADAWHRISTEVDQIKQLVFTRRRPELRPPELKSVWLRSPESKEKYYLKPYGLTPGDLSQGVDVLYGVMGSGDIVYAGVVVDTRAVARFRAGRPDLRITAQIVHRAAYEALVSGLNGFLTSCGPASHGILIHDMVQTAQAAGSGFQAGLKKSHRAANGVSEDAFLLRYVHRLPEKTVAARTGRMPRLIGEMHFEDSAGSNFLQIADVAAYNLLRQFQKFGDQWGETRDVLQMDHYPYFGLLLPRFVAGSGGDTATAITIVGEYDDPREAPAAPAEEPVDDCGYDDGYDDSYGWLDDGDMRSMHGRV